MNEPTPLTPVPPKIPSSGPPWPPALPPPLGSNPEDQAPVSGVVGAIEALLRHPRRLVHRFTRPGPGQLITSLLLLTIGCSVVYGLVVGTFSNGMQLWAAPVKIVAGLLISAFICLPSLYIFSCIGGSQARLVEVLGLLAGLLALMTILLIGFAPVAWVFSQSTKSVAAMGAMHIAFWLVATFFGLRFMNAGFNHFSSRAGAGFKVWTIIFLLVACQMTTALRPILGTAKSFLPASEDKKFFVTYWLECIDNDPAVTLPPAKQTAENWPKAAQP